MPRDHPPPPPDAVARQLVDQFRHAGYVRRPRAGDRSWWLPPAAEDDWEVRFVFRSVVELRDLHRLLLRAGFKPSKPFRRSGFHMLALPGRKAVERLHKLW